MTERFLDMLLRLSTRERRLLVLLVFVITPVAVWFAVLEPLEQSRRSAERDLLEARALTAWVAERAGEKTRLSRSEDSGPRPPIGSSALEQSLISAELRDQVSALSNRAGGVIDLRFDTVPFVEFGQWLSQSDPGWGYDITNMRLERTDTPGIISADLILSPQTNN